MSPAVQSEGSHLTATIHILSHNHRMLLQARTLMCSLHFAAPQWLTNEKNLEVCLFFCTEKIKLILSHQLGGGAVLAILEDTSVEN
jgi:hypothetical protein